MTTKPLLSRKDISEMLGDVSVESVRRNEKRLGLDKARCDINSRMVRYRRRAAIRGLIASGALEVESVPNCYKL